MRRGATGSLIGLAVLTLLLGSCSSPPKGPVPLHATAEHAFVDPDGEAVILNGLNVVPVWDDRPGETWGQEHYDAIAGKGFNSVRLVLYWTDFEPRRGEFSEASVETLDSAIQRAKAAGLYVILDMIHLFGDGGGMQWVPEWAITGDSVETIQANAHGYLGMLATRYRDEPAVAAYDLVNEPHRWPIDQNGVLAMYDDLIESVRRADPEKIVMVEPSYGDAPISPRCVDLGELRQRHNVVLAIHYYFAGGDDDGFDANCWRAGDYASDGHTGYDTTDPIALRRHLEHYTRVLAQQRIPLYIGEFGMGDRARNRDEWLDEMRGLFDEHQLSRAWWEYRTTDGGSFSATDRDGNWRPFVDKLVARPRFPVTLPPVVPVIGEVTVMATGDFTGCTGAEECERSTTARIRDVMVARDPDAILGLGDFQYQYVDRIWDGFDLIFGPKPDRLWAKIYPTAGPTHDVKGCTDSHYQDYWERDPMEPYSFEIGDWHVISLPSAVYRYGCDPAAVLAWLEQDLAANTKRCTIAFWQDPYWTRPTEEHSREDAVRPWVEKLYAHRADVILQGSNHNYQRFTAQDPDDRPDPIRGISAFVVGTGGVGHYAFTGAAPNVAASTDTTFGALELTLRSDGYDWSFLSVPSGGFTDFGSDRCH